jgi:hypothetical protein
MLLGFEPHQRAYAFGYLIGRVFVSIVHALIYLVVAPALYLRSLFGRKPPRPRGRPRPTGGSGGSSASRWC